MTSTQKLITENIALWTSAIAAKSASGRGFSSKRELYGIKKLRELILELAVRGKLVSQAPNDEPASNLLERIAAEKAQLVKEKKIKKPKALPAINEDEKSFELPEGWEWVRLGELFNSILSGGTPSKREPAFWGGDIPWASVKDLGKDRYIASTEDYITEAGLEAGSKLADTGDLLICTRMGLGKIGIAKRPVAFNQDLKAVKLSSGVNVEFFLNTYTTVKIKGTGTTVAGIKQEQLMGYVVGLPSATEQNRIVAKVDELMALCDQLEQETESSLDAHATLVDTLLATLTNSADANELAANWTRIADHFDTLFTTKQSIDVLKQTVLQLAVMGKLVSFGQHLVSGTLKDHLSFGPRNGLSPKEVPGDTGLKVLKLGATSYGNLDLAQSKSVDVDVASDSHLWLRKGDILVQRGNSANFVGCNCLIRKDVANFIYPDLMMKVRAAKGLLPEYLSLWLSAPDSRQFMWDRMTGTSGTMPKISKKVVEAVPIIVPSEEAQREIVAKVDQLMALCDQLKQRISQAQQTQLHIADAMVDSALGRAEIKEMTKKNTEKEMKITTLLTLGPDFNRQSGAILAFLISEDGGESDAKKVWARSSLDLPTFYKQLKMEISLGYINNPAKADFEV